MNPISYYRRNLPHYQPPYAIFHVCFRLAGSIPAAVIEQLQSEAKLRTKRLGGVNSPKVRAEMAAENHRLHLEAFEQALHAGSTGPLWLSRSAIAAIVVEALLYHDKKDYDLIAYTVMPNHVHLVIELVKRDDIPLYKILHSIKRYTARHANMILHRKGQFWQPESYDHVIRDQEGVENIIEYVLCNPVKAGLASSIENWPWSYCKYSDSL